MALRQVMVIAAAFSVAFVPGAHEGPLSLSLNQIPATAAENVAPPRVVAGNLKTPPRMSANAVSGGISELVSRLPGFGGLWVDDAGLTHLAVQSDHAPEIIHVLGRQFHDEYVLDIVDHSYSDLVARRDAITAQIDSLGIQGLELVQWGQDEAHNTVWIPCGTIQMRKPLWHKVF